MPQNLSKQGKRFSKQEASKKIILGVETLRCPRCGQPNQIEVHSDLPLENYLECRICKYRALVNFAAILDKYGLPHGLSRNEKRQLGKHLMKDVARLN